MVIFAIRNDTTITNVDVHAVIRLDAVDGFEFCASDGLISQLIISTSVDDCTLDIGSLKGTTSNGDDGTLAVLGLTTSVGLV